MSRGSPIGVTGISATRYNDIIDFRTQSLLNIGDPRYTISVVDQTYRINIQQSGVLGIISGIPLPVRGIIDSIPPEDGAIGNAQSEALSNIAFGIAYTLARDTNGNNLLDSSDQFIDYKAINSNVSGFVLFQKSVTPGTYFLELTDTTPGDYSRSVSGILFDPGPLYGEALGSISDPKGGANPNPNPNPTSPPDLSVRTFNVVPSALFAGETFPLELNIQNTGGRASGRFDIKVYVSTDQTITLQDELIGSYFVDDLEGDDNTSATVTPTLPSLNDSFWRGSRTYYVGVIVDSGRDVIESLESNNTTYEAVEIFLVDSLQYGASNPDLIQAFGYNVEAFEEHYRNSGRFEGRPVSVFSPSQYLASNPDLIGVLGNNPRLATEHYLTYGFFEGRARDNFPEKLYLASHDDLLRSFGSDVEAATQHYINSGFAEKRTLNRFNPTQYLASNKDLIFAFGNNPEAALDHFIQSGYKEKRSRDSFAEDIYLASHGDLIRAFGYNLEAATQHYINIGVSERRAENLFDPVGYLNKYKDLKSAFGNNLAAATQHYILSGFAEGRTWI